jgi:serine/threonine-protein kinase
MNQPHDPNRTIDHPSALADSLDAGLAAGFGPPRSSLGDLRPVLLKEAEGESGHVVQPGSDAMPSPGQAGDRYQLQGEIARGGMGAVMRGRDVDLGRDLAVKVLLEKHAHRPEVARRFIEEAQIAGQLQHPGVVPVYDIGQFGNRPFFTMKLVKGQTLAHLLGERTDPVADRPRFLGIALQVAQTLAYAHAKGVIHRDLKPANIMVGAFGEVQVMDWGLAKVLASRERPEEASREREQPDDASLIRTARSTGSAGSFGTQTEAGSLLGTPAYMPPEQANGDVALLDRRADVFGLGAILCEVLTGKPPYVGRSAEEVRRKAANGDLADAQARLAACGADTELVTLTRTCLSPEAVDRPKDAQSVADALTAYQDGVQARLHQAELAEAEAHARAVEEAKRRRLTLTLATTVLLALTLGGGGWLWVKSDRDARQAQVTRDVNDALSKATAFRQQAKPGQVGSAALFAQAREQVQRALALVENGPAADDLRAQVHKLGRELDEEEQDRRFLAALDAAELERAKMVLDENRFADELLLPRFRAAFRDYGLAPGAAPPAAAAARIRQRPRPVREATLAALDEWLDLAVNFPKAKGEPHLTWLRATLLAAEPDDGWRRRSWVALANKDPARRRAALEKLAVQADVDKLPVRSLIQLTDRLGAIGSWDSAVRLLRKAHQRFPADLWVNHNLGRALQQVTPPDLAESVRYLTAAVALRPDSSGFHLNLGNALRRNGQVDEAMACYQQAITSDPRYAAAHDNLGLLLKDKGQGDAAIACHRKAIKLNPRFASAHNNLGVALRAKGREDEAIASYRKALKLDPKYAKALSNLGIALWQVKKDHEGAIACLRKAIMLDPQSVSAHSDLGVVLLQSKKDCAGAISCLRKAIKLDPNSAGAHTNLGNALDEKGQVDEAIACYRKAITLDPKFAGVHYDLGLALARKKKVDEAIACYRKAIDLDPKEPAFHTDLGLALKDKGKVDEAIACHKKAIEIDPKYAKAHFNLGSALKDRSQLDEAIACYKRGIKLDPKDVKGLGNLGIALKDRGQLDEAIACFKKVIELDPKEAVAHLNLGVALHLKGKLSEAIASYRKAVLLNPKNPTTHNNLGLALADRGKVDEAIACYRKALELAPKDAGTHYNLGSALLAKGQLDEAIACYRRAIELDPKHDRAHNNLGSALARQGRVEEAIICHQRAIEFNPKNAMAHNNLGHALDRLGQVDQAIPCFKKATLLDPKLALAHNGLGAALARKNRIEEAIACFRQAIASDPKLAAAHFNLGNCLLFTGHVDEAIACFRQATKLDPKLVITHLTLSMVLHDKGQIDEAIASLKKAALLDPMNAEIHNVLGGMYCDKKRDYDAAITWFRKAIALAPKLAKTHFNLGNALYHKGQLDEAISCYQRAIQLNPKEPRTHGALGEVLLGKGKYAEAQGALVRARDLFPDQHPLRASVSRQAQECERLLKLEKRLPLILAGKDKPTSARQCLDLVAMCHRKGWHATATRFSAEAFAADPKLADDLKAGHRYQAACHAALAAAGQGAKATILDARARAGFRKQALEWLRGDLAQYTKLSENGPPATRLFVQRQMTQWQHDTRLASIRQSAALARLPAKERAAFEKLWVDVARLKKAQP